MNIPALSLPSTTAPGTSTGSSTESETPFGDLVESFVDGQSSPEPGASDQVTPPLAEPDGATGATAGESESTSGQPVNGDAVEDHGVTDTMATGQESIEDASPGAQAVDGLALALAALLGVQTAIRPVLAPVAANRAGSTNALETTSTTVLASSGANRPSSELPLNGLASHPTPTTPVRGSGAEATSHPQGPETLQPSGGTDAPGATSTVQHASNGPLVDVRPLAPSTAAAAVHRQVFPEVARLVSTGNGTHRMTLRLDPGSLGEVRITLTVRGGAVRVSLAAGLEASNALLVGSSDLRRLLERSGADNAQVTVRELAGRPTPHITPAETFPSHTASNQNGGGLSNDAGRFERGTSGGSAGTPDPHARTRERITATEGTRDSTHLSHPVHPEASTRTAGLDVTM